MKFGWAASAADRRLLPEGRLAGPMPWVIAIMIFLTILAAAAGLGLDGAADSLRADLAGRVTVQIVEADREMREASAVRVMRAIDRLSNVRAVRRVDDREMDALLAPWLGTGGGAGLGEDVPVPALIDADLMRVDDAALAELTAAARGVTATARVDAHARWLAPLAGLVGMLKWLAAALVLLMAIATAAAVVLAARAALNTHRATIDVLHLLGGTDIQIARLFQRRIALDALFGGIVGLVGAIVVILLLATRMNAVGSDLLGSVRLAVTDWGVLIAIPVAGALLATLAARLTVVRALRRIL